jgi:hypothetical protein
MTWAWIALAVESAASTFYVLWAFRKPTEADLRMAVVPNACTMLSATVLFALHV